MEVGTPFFTGLLILILAFVVIFYFYFARKKKKNNHKFDGDEIVVEKQDELPKNK